MRERDRKTRSEKNAIETRQREANNAQNVLAKRMAESKYEQHEQ